MNLHDWIDEVCDALDIDVDLDEAVVLDLARDAAHGVQRPAAPLTTYLLGIAVGQRGASPEAIEQMAGEISELAQRWDRPSSDDDEDDEILDDSFESDEAYDDPAEEN